MGSPVAVFCQEWGSRIAPTRVHQAHRANLGKVAVGALHLDVDRVRRLWGLFASLANTKELELFSDFQGSGREPGHMVLRIRQRRVGSEEGYIESRMAVNGLNGGALTRTSITDLEVLSTIAMLSR